MERWATFDKPVARFGGSASQYMFILPNSSRFESTAITLFSTKHGLPLAKPTIFPSFSGHCMGRPPGLAGLAAAPFGSAPCGGRGGQWRRPCGRPGGAQGATAAVLRHQRGDAEDGQEELGGPGVWGYLEDTKGWCNVSLGYLYRFIMIYPYIRMHIHWFYSMLLGYSWLV